MIGMTGFGEALAESAGLRLQVRIHGVNHRFLDIVLRVPDELRFAEALARERVAAVARRGRCELAVIARRTGSSRPLVQIDPEAIAAVVDAARPLVGAGLVRGELTLGDLLRQPALLRVESAEAAWGEDDEALLERALAEALNQFAKSRTEEGEKTRQALLRILGEVERAADELRAAAPAANARLAEAARTRLAELMRDSGSSDDRWLHEAALLAEKGDVREEIDRLGAHLNELARMLRDDDGGGRRIDFVAQELLRELNTLAAKCRDVGVVQTALHARLLCEQIREQAQNVE
jgi:uncharacterized protein (TIGR00255 family)